MLAVLVACVLVALWWQRRGRSSRGQRPPDYPGRLPLIGHGHLLIHKDKVFDLLKGMTKFTREKQCDSITFDVGPFATYVLTDPDDCFTVSNTCLRKSFLNNLLVRATGWGIGTSKVDLWKRHRKLINPAFSPSILNEFVRTFNYKAKHLLRGIAQQEGKGPFKPDHFITEYVFESTCHTLLNINTENNIDKSFIHLTDDFFKILWERFQKFWLLNETIYSWSFLRKKEDKIIDAYMDFVRKPMLKRRSEMLQHTDKADAEVDDFNLANDKKPLMDQLLHLQHTKDAFTDKEILHNLFSYLFAGYDTTSTTLVYVFLVLGTYKRVQDRIYKELQEVFGDSDRDVDKEDLNKLVYLDAAIKETLRLYPVGSFVSRFSETEVKLKQQYTLPAGSNIVLLFYAVNRHPIWGPDADEFRPERWLEPGGVPDNHTTFTSFSIGKRSCMGRLYAMLLMKVTCAHFLRRYRITGDISKMEVHFDSLMMAPKSGHEITIEPRV